jgi:hypothetical protein
VGISLRHGFGVWEMRELMIVLVASLLLGTLLWLAVSWRVRATTLDSRALRGIPWRLAAVCVVFAVGCSALQQRRDQTRHLAYETSFALHSSPRFWALAAPLVDEPGKSHNIALTGGPLQNSDNWFYYFFLGSRFQNTVSYVPPTKDGGVAYFGPHGDFDQRADADKWLERLKNRHITDVLTFPPYSTEQRWMDERPDKFEKPMGGFDWGLYRVR